MKILYKLTTRSRPERMFKAIQNIRTMALEKDPTILVTLDRDDPTLQSSLDLLYPMRDMNVYTKVGLSKNKIDAINRDINLTGDTGILNAFAIRTAWDIIVATSDDIKFLHGFDEIINKDAANLPGAYSQTWDGVIWYGDGAKHGKILTVPILTRAYYDRLGYIYNPVYASLFADEEAIYVGEKLKRIYYSKSEIMIHEHPAWGKAEWDAQYRHTDSFYSADKVIFDKRKALGFPL